MQAAAGPGWDKLKHKNVAHTSVSVVKHMQLLSLSQIFALTDKCVHLSIKAEYFHCLSEISDRYLQCQHEANFSVLMLCSGQSMFTFYK